MTIDDWFARYPWRNLCEACKGTGLRHDDGVLHVPRETCTDCLGDRLHFALMNYRHTDEALGKKPATAGFLFLGTSRALPSVLPWSVCPLRYPR